jgi:hypothetical protein
LSTLNVQHLESLYDTVERFTGTRQKERVPDAVLQQADQVVNVDLPAEDLQERLRQGKVYPPDRAARALDGYFTSENLEQLRELALEHLAHLLDRRRQERQAGAGGEAGGSERVMVCVSSRSPNAPRLLRAGARLADRLGAPWYAVYIQTPAEAAEKVDAATERRVADTLGPGPAGERGADAVPGGGRGGGGLGVRPGIRDHPHRGRPEPAGRVAGVVRPDPARPDRPCRPGSHRRSRRDDLTRLDAVFSVPYRHRSAAVIHAIGESQAARSSSPASPAAPTMRVRLPG